MVKRGKFKVEQRVCADWAGGHGQGGKGKHCVRFKKVKVTKYSDVGSKGHGKLSEEQRSSIQKSIHKGAFGSGAFSSVDSCRDAVDRQRNRGVPKALIVKRVGLIKTFNKNKRNHTFEVAKSCLTYAQR